MRHFLNRDTAFLRPKYDIIWINEHFCISSTSLFQWALPNQNRCGYCKSSLCLRTPNFCSPTIRNSWPNNSQKYISYKRHTSLIFFWNEKIFSMTSKTETFHCRIHRKKIFSGLKRKIKYSSFHNWMKAVLHKVWTGFILYCQPPPPKQNLEPVRGNTAMSKCCSLGCTSNKHIAEAQSVLAGNTCMLLQTQG